MDFFHLSKLIWDLAAPSSLLLMLSAAAAALLIFGRAKAGRAVAILAAALFALVGLLPVGDWLLQPLEAEFPRPNPPPAHVDGVLTLGGGLGDRVLATRGAFAPEGSLARLVETVRLARRYPDARLVFSGGWGRYPDAAAAQAFYAAVGLDPARLLFERASRNTYENLVFSRRLAKPGETWLLATSAFQMPRAMAVARRLGWRLVPWPTDYVTTPGVALPFAEPTLDIPRNLARADLGAKEWIGRLAYQLSGMAR